MGTKERTGALGPFKEVSPTQPYIAAAAAAAAAATARNTAQETRCAF